MAMMKVTTHQGGFESERIYSFLDIDGNEISMCAPKHYFPYPGWVQARLIRECNGGSTVSLPSIQCWEAVTVPSGIVRDEGLPSKVIPH